MIKDNLKYNDGHDGKTEDGVVAFVFKGAKRRLRMNAGRRKIMVKSHGGIAADWAGAKVRLYQTADIWAGKVVSAVAMDAQLSSGQWLIYSDFQTKRGRKAAEEFHATQRRDAANAASTTKKTQPAPSDEPGLPTYAELRSAIEQSLDKSGITLALDMMGHLPEDQQAELKAIADTATAKLDA